MANRQEGAAAVSEALDGIEEPANTRIERQARRTEAVSMALAGLTYEQIGERLGISAQGAHALVERTIIDTRNYAVDQLRALENARLDRAQAAIWSSVLEGDIKAVNTFLRISERRAKMNGLDAPNKVQMAVSVRQEMEQALVLLEEVILDAETVDEEDVVEVEERKALSHVYEIEARDE